MKKYLIILSCILGMAINVHGQSLKISSMPVSSSPGDSMYFPVIPIQGGSNLKILGKNVAISKVDSMWISGGNLFYRRWGNTQTAGATGFQYSNGFGLLLGSNTFSVDSTNIATFKRLYYVRDSFRLSPNFLGVPTAPTASNGTNTTQLATTQFVQTAVAAGGAGGVNLNNRNIFTYTYSGSSTFTIPSVPSRIYSVIVYNNSNPQNNPIANYTWSAGSTSLTVTDALITGDVVYIDCDLGLATALTYSPAQNLNAYGAFVNNNLDSIRGGTIIGTAGAGYYGFPSQSIRPSAPSGLGLKEYTDSLGRRTYIGSNNLSRSFDAAGQTVNRAYRFQDRNYTFADSADVAGKANLTTAATGLTAAGTNQSNGLALSGNNSIQEITTAAASTGVVLPVATATSAIVVVNRGANAVQVYPATSGVINGQSANTAYTLQPNTSVKFYGKDATSWYTVNARRGGDVNDGDGSNALTLANVLTAGSCTSCNLTYDAKGRITVAANGSGGSGPTLTLTPTQNYNAYGNFVNNTLDSTRGGKLLSGGIGFPKATNSTLSGTDFISEGFDSASHKYIRYSSNINGGYIRSFDPNITANRLLAWPNLNAIDTLATLADVRVNAGGITALTSEVTATGPGSVAATITKTIAPTWTGVHDFNPTLSGGAAATDNGVLIAPTITQSSTANYAGLKVSVFENTTGSGNKFLIDAGISTGANNSAYTSKFSVDKFGNLITGGITSTAGLLTMFKIQTTAVYGNSVFATSDPNFFNSSTTLTGLPYTYTGNSIGTRRLFRSSTNLTATVGNDVAGTVFGQEQLTMAASGTHAFFSTALFLPPVITSGVATLTEASTVTISDAPNLGTNKYALHVVAGNVNFGGGQISQINATAKTTGYTVTATDYVIRADASGGNFNVTLPTAVGITGQVYCIKSISTGTVTVATTSSQNIRGLATATTFSLAAIGKLVWVQSNGTDWDVINSN